MQDLVGEDREQGQRAREEGGHEIEPRRPHHDRRREHEAQSRLQRLDGVLRAARGHVHPPRRADEGERQQHGHEGERVHAVDERDGMEAARAGAERGVGGSAGSGQAAREQEAGHAGAADERGVEHREVQGEGARQLGLRDEARDEPVARGVVEGGGGGRRRVERVERGEGGVAAHREQGQGGREQRHRALGDEEDPLAVHPVGDDPAAEREGDDGQHPREAHEAEGEGRMGQQVDVPVEGHRLHLGARHGDELGGPEQAEVAVAEGVVGAARHGRPVYPFCC